MVGIRRAAPKGASGFEDFVASLKRCPDTKQRIANDQRPTTDDELMATTGILRSRRSAAQLHALASVEREIRAIDPAAGRKYLRDFREAYRSYQKVLTPSDVRHQIANAGIVLVGDYHATLFSLAPPRSRTPPPPRSAGSRNHFFPRPAHSRRMVPRRD